MAAEGTAARGFQIANPNPAPCRPIEPARKHQSESERFGAFSKIPAKTNGQNGPLKALGEAQGRLIVIAQRPFPGHFRGLGSVLDMAIPRFIDSPKNRLPWGDFWIRHGA